MDRFSSRMKIAVERVVTDLAERLLRSRKGRRMDDGVRDVGTAMAGPEVVGCAPRPVRNGPRLQKARLLPSARCHHPEDRSKGRGVSSRTDRSGPCSTRGDTRTPTRVEPQGRRMAKAGRDPADERARRLSTPCRGSPELRALGARRARERHAARLPTDDPTKPATGRSGRWITIRPRQSRC